MVLGWWLRGCGDRVEVRHVRAAGKQCSKNSDCGKGQSCSNGTCVDVALMPQMVCSEMPPLVQIVLP